MAPQRSHTGTSRPLIGLTGRRKRGGQIDGFPRSLHDLGLDVFVADYASGVLEAGGLPVFLSPDGPAVELVERLDGIVLTGGADLDPALWGAGAETDRFPPEPLRDRFELAVVDGAMQAGRPVLGICRGMQLLNVHGGGSLHQDVPAHAGFEQPAGSVAHELAVEPGTLLGELCGERLLVNSLHHQTVDRLAPGWVVSATSTDGTVEAIELPGHRVIGVQWHPELLAGRPHDPLFAWVVEQARSTAAASRRAGEVGAR